MSRLFNEGAKRRRFDPTGLGAASILEQPDGAERKGARPGPPKTIFTGVQMSVQVCARQVCVTRNASFAQESASKSESWWSQTVRHVAREGVEEAARARREQMHMQRDL